MNFVDEVTIRVQAGNGGHGCLSFLREKFIEKGGPDGGDGGSGGNVYLVADNAINTLADFRFVRHLKAKNGDPGSGRNKTGKSGEDLDVIVACGTVVHDIDTNELMGDLTEVGQRLMVAEAGCAGLGNAHFKSSTNRAPRKTTEGIIGEKRHLKLELKLLAEVGLVGLPNAGKSTLIRAMSAARPKVADYPFTTLHPNLGVVSVGPLQSFVMADVPGLIAGAAEGAGLGIQFLKHLQRTKLLLHLVDIAPIDPHTDVANEFRVIERELVKFSKNLSGKTRWLILNKIDLLTDKDAIRARKEILDELEWDGPVFDTSAVSGDGTEKLAQAIMRELERTSEKNLEGAID